MKLRQLEEISKLKGMSIIRGLVNTSVQQHGSRNEYYEPHAINRVW